MDDKEVGKFWRMLQELEPLNCLEATGLIRKLVDERAARLYERAPHEPYSAQQALLDFGIDPTTWEG